MAKKYRVEVEAGTDEAKRKLGDVADKLDDIGAGAGKASEHLGKIGKGAPGLDKTFKSVGMSIKSAVASLGVFALIFELFRNNQKVMDIFNAGMAAIQYIFNDLMKIVSPLLDAVMGLFTTPGDSIKKLGQMIKDYVINYFNQAWDIIKNVGGAIANLFTGDWDGLKANLKEIGTSIGDAILGTEGATEKMIENVKTATKEAVALTSLLNKVKIAEAELEKLREKGDLRLEKLRQLRDDESTSLADRIQANKDLGAELEAQIEAELSLAKLKTEAARQEAIKSGLVDDQAEYIRAQANEIAIMNRLEGQRSEQLMNTNALLREQKDIERGVRDTEMQLADLRDEQAKVEMSNTLDKLNFELEAIDRKEQRQIEALNNELSLTAQGTARYQELLNEKALVEEQANLDRLTKQQEVFDEEVRVAQEAAEAKKAADKAVADYNKQLADQKKERDKAVASAQIQTAETVLGTVSAIAGENAGVQKGISIAEAVINTYKGATMALGSAPPPYSFIMAAAVIAAGIANVVKIIKTKIPKSKGGDSGSASISGGGGAGSSGGGARPGTFSMVQPLSQQLSQNLSGELATKPQRAYVTQGDIESAAELDNHIKTNARP